MDAAPLARPQPPAPGPRPVRAFVLRFALAFLLLEGLVYLVLWRERWFAPYGELNARLTAGLLRAFDLDARAMGSLLVTPGFSFQVRPGCDAYQAGAVFLAGLLAFPAPRARKLAGAVVGLALLCALNLLRLSALMWTGIHQRAHFDVMHIEALPALFVLVSLALFFGWSRWARA